LAEQGNQARSFFSVLLDTPDGFYPLLGSEEILDAAKEAEKRGVDCFSIVTSGKA